MREFPVHVITRPLGLWVTVTGHRFQNSSELACRFGENLDAVEIRWNHPMMVMCRIDNRELQRLYVNKTRQVERPGDRDFVMKTLWSSG